MMTWKRVPIVINFAEKEDKLGTIYSVCHLNFRELYSWYFLNKLIC